MILQKLYTIPKDLFEPIKFHNGLNIIFAHKDEVKTSDSNNLIDEEKTSLHAVGKSTVLDFILFALLADFTEKSSHRLFNAYNNKILHGISVVLEFSINQKNYKLTRSFDEPNRKIYFGPINKPREPYDLYKLRTYLFNLLFFRKDYPGIITHHSYQRLLSFFIKVKKREELFSDPILFSHNLSDLDLAPFHFFLLNIDNTLPTDHRDLYESILKLESTLRENEKLIKDISKTKDLDEIKNKRQKLFNDISKLEKRISGFTLKGNYSDIENKADELTKEIKKLWFSNSVDRKKLAELEEYEKSLPSEAYEDVDKITQIYNEVNALLAGNIKKEIQDAVEFRKTLHTSRKEYVIEEKGRLNNSLLNRSQKIETLESERKKLLDELSSQGALEDLTNAYVHLAKLQKEYSDIDASLKSIDKLVKAISEKHDEHTSLLNQLDDYLNAILPDAINFRDLLTSIYKKLFLDTHEVKIFDVSETDERQKIKISVLEGSIIDSTGINQVRTLIYDTAVLLNIINQNLIGPHFIAHDGIFENLHKSHFFAFINFIQELLDNKYQFQYILTLNDHDFLDDIKDFRESTISSNCIIKLTPKKNFLGSGF